MGQHRRAVAHYTLDRQTAYITGNEVFQLLCRLSRFVGDGLQNRLAILFCESLGTAMAPTTKPTVLSESLLSRSRMPANHPL